jgi:putative transcription factor
MRCEVCGRKIIGLPYRSMIEGAKMLVCSNCSKLGSVYLETKTEPRLKKVARRLPTPVHIPRRQPSLSDTESLELANDFGSKVRQAREKLGLSHEELGKKISEKVSVLRKIESGKMTPDNVLTEKLQHSLRIQLLVPISEPKVPSQALATRLTSPTLADIAQVKKEKPK